MAPTPAAIAAELPLPMPVGPKGSTLLEQHLKVIDNLSAQQVAALRPLENGSRFTAPTANGREIDPSAESKPEFTAKQPSSGAGTIAPYQAMPYVAQQSTITHNYTPALPVMEACDHISQEVSTVHHPRRRMLVASSVTRPSQIIFASFAHVSSNTSRISQVK